jgi:preprotein translocase subunit YajC
MLYATVMLLAQEAAKEAVKGAGEGPPGWTQFMPIILMVIAFYFILFLPSRRERQQRATLLAALKKNDEVETSGGVFGVVQSIKEGADEVVLKIDEGKMRVRKSAIVRVIPKEAPGGQPAGGALSEAIQKPPRG